MFIDVETEMRGLNWGAFYARFHANAYNSNDVHDKLKALYADYFVKNRKGVFEYILGGCTDTKLLDIRIFDDVTKQTVYERQTTDATARGVSNCPLCALGSDNNRQRIFDTAHG